MSITELIDQLADIGQKIGHESKVVPWMLAQPQPLTKLDIVGLEAGWDKSRRQPIATLKLAVK